MKRNSRFYIFFVVVAMLLAACSTTKKVPDGDQLYVGLTKINYQNYDRNDHFYTTRDEMEAALACAPNGALFGSSYYRTPFPYGLWVWNAFSESTGPIGKWIAKSFGKAPVLMSWVNPELRASVAQSVLKTHGYFRGNVSFEAITQRNPKKAKIGYTVDMGPLFTLDSISYVNFSPAADSLLQAHMNEAKVKRGDAFDVSTLDAERKRVGNLFRNNGYYYYQPDYASYLADTLLVPEKVQLKFQLADSVPSRALRKWYIGNIDMQLRKQFFDSLDQV